SGYQRRRWPLRRFVATSLAARLAAIRHRLVHQPTASYGYALVSELNRCWLAGTQEHWVKNLIPQGASDGHGAENTRKFTYETKAYE
ncbi:MAG TPA: hypothetical protein VIZ90_05330, partial [Rhizobiaceae bacterium]